MISHLRLRAAAFTLLSLQMTACSLAPAYTRPEAPVPETIAVTPASALSADGMFQVSPWGFFQDPRLRELIAAALRQNRDLRQALLSIEETRAQYRVQRADRLPQLTGEASDAYEGVFDDRAGNRYGDNRYAVTGVAFFEPDLFGRLKNMSDAALRRYLATEEAEKAVRIALVSQVAQSYLAERLAAELGRLVERTLVSRQTSYAFVERRVQSGQSSLLDLEQARGLVEAAKADAAARKDERIRAENALKLLLGSFAVQQLPPPTALMEQRFAELPDGIPSVVLLKRPDIMEAEFNLKAANAEIGAARAAFFPSITLTGKLGSQSDELRLLFDGVTSFWSFLPTISLPVFSGGRNKANLELAEIRKEKEIVQYEQRIQTAFREVTDGLLTRAALAEKLAAQERYLQSQRLVLQLATSNYTNGAVSYLTVLDAQRSVFEAERELLAARREQLANDISLYAALGGGLEDTKPAEGKSGSAIFNQ
ncbi:MAG: efflux transporter outer membrane subunit [Desulfovibrio sp.]|jgi:Cu(I)/Ag(I) efflux system outer membrane protein|nr:efflux transporter outer membrane subunit [Desulfovibrio sp.]